MNPATRRANLNSSPICLATHNRFHHVTSKCTTVLRSIRLSHSSSRARADKTAGKMSAAFPHSLPAADNRSKIRDRTATIRAIAVRTALDIGGVDAIAAATVTTVPISVADINNSRAPPPSRRKTTAAMNLVSPTDRPAALIA